jgi:hypothetical protein
VPTAGDSPVLPDNLGARGRFAPRRGPRRLDLWKKRDRDEQEAEENEDNSHRGAPSAAVVGRARSEKEKKSDCARLSGDLMKLSRPRLR